MILENVSMSSYRGSQRRWDSGSLSSSRETSSSENGASMVGRIVSG